MKNRTTQNHVIHFLFPIALFFMFAALSFTLILFSADSYANITNSVTSTEDARTTFAYLSNKLNQSDSDGAISIGTFQGRDSVVIKATESSEIYYTYIYEENNILYELFIKDGTTIDPTLGTPLMEVEGFSIKELNETLYSLSYSSTEGEMFEKIFSPKTY